MKILFRKNKKEKKFFMILIFKKKWLIKKQIENLEEKIKELENKLIKKESDYNRLSVNYANYLIEKKYRNESN